jgi:hypothetical protein
MRGPNPSYPIDLTDAEAKGFEQLIRASSIPQALVMRVRIILTAYQHRVEVAKLSYIAYSSGLVWRFRST